MPAVSQDGEFLTLELTGASGGTSTFLDGPLVSRRRRRRFFTSFSLPHHSWPSTVAYLLRRFNGSGGLLLSGLSAHCQAALNLLRGRWTRGLQVRVLPPLL